MPGPFDPLDPAVADASYGNVRMPQFVANNLAAPTPAAPTTSSPAPQGPITSPSQAVAAAPPAAEQPEPPRQTLAQFNAAARGQGPITSPSQIAPPKAAPMGSEAAIGDAGRQEQEAIGERKRALQTEADVSSASARQEADVLAAANRKVAAQMAEQEQQRKVDQAESVRMQAELRGAMDQFANAKVDPSRFWHDSGTGSKVLMGIGLALGAAGQALTRGQQNNAALDIIQNAIKQDVALQMHQQEKLGQVVGQRGQALDRMLQITKDRQATMNAAIAAGYEYVGKQIGEIAARTKDPMAQAQAKGAQAVLSQDAATLQDKANQDAAARIAAQRAEAERERAARASEGIAYGHLALERQQQTESRREFDLTRSDRRDEEAMKLLAAGNTAGAKAMESGLTDPATGMPIVQPAAQPMIDQAKALTEQAAKEQDPNKRIALQQQAYDLKTRAAAQYSIPARDKETATKIQANINNIQNFVDTADDLIGKLGKDPGTFDMKEWARIANQYHDVVVKSAAAVGEKLNAKAIDAMSHALGDDPSKWGNRLADLAVDKREAIMAGLEQSIRDFQSAGKQETKGIANLDFARPSDRQREEDRRAGKTAYEQAASVNEKTSAEEAEAATPGKLSSWNPLSENSALKRKGDMTPQDLAEEKAIRESGTTTGLSAKQSASVRELAANALREKGDNRADNVTKLVDLATSKRPGLASGTLAELRDNAPDVYREVRARLPESQRAALERTDAGRSESGAQFRGQVEPGAEVVGLKPTTNPAIEMFRRAPQNEILYGVAAGKVKVPDKHRRDALEQIRRFDPQGYAELEGK